jgi:Transposase DDE domain
MGTDLSERVAHPLGEQPEVEEWSTVADTFAGRVHIEWDTAVPVTPLGQLPFFIEYLKQGGLFDGWVADCRLSFTSPNAPRKRDVLSTLLLSVLAGHRCYAQVTALRCDAVNPPLLGMSKVISEDALRRALVKIDETAGSRWLGFAEGLGGKREVWEYAALVTSRDSEILTLGQLYRDRADCENAFDELKNHWGWGGFTTQDLKRCRLLAASVALIYNWWSLFVRLADPDHHREVITSRPLLLQAIARKTQHAGRTTLSVSSTHGEQQVARRAYLRIARFFASLRATAEQLDAVQRWYRILSEALRKYLRGRQLIPPARLQPG